MERERCLRIIKAVLANVDNWCERVDEISEAAIPVTGNKARALSLLRDMRFAQISLKRLAGLDDIVELADREGACDTPPDPDQS